MGDNMAVRLKSIFIGLAAIVVAFFLFWFSEGVREGVRNGIALCLETVIPSLFLFTALTIFSLKSGLIAALGKILDPFSRLCFDLSGEQFSVMLASFVSGYPVGARLISELYKSNRVSEKKARKMLDFCVCAGPGFIVLAVGEGSLFSRADGYRLLIAHLLSAVLMAFLGRFVNKSNTENAPKQQLVTPAPLSLTFTESVCDAARTMLSVSAFVVAFSGLGGIASSLQATPIITKTIKAALEVTVGIGLFGRKQLPIIAFLLGFGGISVHFQVLSSVRELHYPYYRLLLSRAVHGALSFGMIILMELISPRVIDTALVDPSVTPKVHGSPAATIVLLCLGIVLIFYCSDAKLKKCGNSEKDVV